MSNPLRVAILSGECGGSAYYRAALVKRALDRDHPDIQAVYLDRWQEALADWVDVLYLVHSTNATISLERVHELQRSGVAVVVDADDYVFAVPAYSQAFLPSRAQAGLERRTHLYGTCDVVTVTTPTMVEHMRKHATQARFVVIPNAFDDSVSLPQPQKRPGGIPVVGWFGGEQHHGDLEAMRDVFDAILACGWGLVFIGSCPAQFKGVGPKTHGKRVAFIPGVADVERYFALCATTGIDVGLAPLVRNPLNDCKSPIKPLEYRYACGVPCVASDVPAYRDAGTGATLVDGFGVDAWLSAISSALGDGARRYHLPPEYRLRNVSPLWADVFRAANKETRR